MLITASFTQYFLGRAVHHLWALKYSSLLCGKVDPLVTLVSTRGDAVGHLNALSACVRQPLRDEPMGDTRGCRL